MSVEDTDLIYVGQSGEYITFFCGKCNREAKLVTIRPNEPNPSTDLKNIGILGFYTECPKCGQTGFFKMDLDAEIKGSGKKE